MSAHAPEPCIPQLSPLCSETRGLAVFARQPACSKLADDLSPRPCGTIAPSRWRRSYTRRVPSQPLLFLHGHPPVIAMGESSAISDVRSIAGVLGRIHHIRRTPSLFRFLGRGNDYQMHSFGGRLSGRQVSGQFINVE
ncbi:hypothetical protein Y600_6053 [Burkholderia pseudomallei MSHR3709]|nr:hypothetical protein Y600_6053 [Burkholderia pseudomallei MSHR3709]